MTTLTGAGSFVISLPVAAGGSEITVSVADFPPHILFNLAMHGLQQKVADSVANAKAKEWTKAECLDKCDSVIASLKAGTWAKKGGGKAARTEEEFVSRKAEAMAKARMEKDEKAKAAGLERVKAAFIKAHGAAWKAEWAAKNAAREAELDFDLSDEG